MSRILIESDLLLAIIKKEDRLKPAAEKILELVDSGRLEDIYASTASLLEVIFWFYNRQMLKELIDALNALTHITNLEWINITPDICLTATILMSEYKISPFDAYHTATAISKDKTILSTEHVYNKIKGVKRIDPRELAERL